MQSPAPAEVATKAAAPKADGKSNNLTFAGLTEFMENLPTMGKAKAGKAGHNGNAHPDKKVWEKDAFDLFQKSTMEFTDIDFDFVGATYEEDLGVTWNGAFGVNADAIPFTSNPPSEPYLAICFRDFFVEDSEFACAMDREGGLLKAVSFYYATPDFVADAVKELGVVVTNLKAVAWSGPEGSGKKLGEATLPLTTGDLDFNFNKAVLKFKGVAKSVTFVSGEVTDCGEAQACFVGALIPPIIDNVKIIAPAGKSNMLAAGAMDVQEKLADLEEKLDEMLGASKDD